MSTKLDKSKHFLMLLLDTTKSQARALLETANPSQVLALSEVLLNLCENSSFSIKFKNLPRRHQLILQRLGDRNTKEKVKYQLVCKHWKLVWESVLLIKTSLVRLLS